MGNKDRMTNLPTIDEMQTWNKRFEYRLCCSELYYFYIIDNETGKDYRSLVDDRLLELLNELNDENVAFKNSDNITELETEIMKLKEENKELKKRLSYAEKVNMGLIDENRRLRLTIIHSSDLNFDIEWLKENLKDWNNKECRL